MNKRNKILWTTLTLALCSAAIYYKVSKSFEHKTAGFAISRIQPLKPYYPNLVEAPLALEGQRELELALMQDYEFIGVGGQCYAFVSKDNKYVVKFLKNHKRIPPFYTKLPMAGPLKKVFNKKIEKIEAKLTADQLSYKLAIENLREESQLIFSHFNVTQNLRKHLHITDKSGRSFSIDLDTVPFMVQRKADLIFPMIDTFMRQGQKDKAKNLIHSIVNTIASRSKKGIYDGDAKIYKNIGCIEDRAMFIDIGRMRPNAEMRQLPRIKKDLYETTDKLRLFLENHHPELKPYLIEQIESVTL